MVDSVDSDPIQELEHDELFFPGQFSLTVVAFRKTTIPLWSEINLGSGQPRILNYLRLNNGCNQKTIADSCMVEGSTITGLLNGLENRGLIIREISETNKREKNVYLTEAGRKKLIEIDNMFKKLNDVCSDDFSEEELEEFSRLSKKLLKNLIKS